MINQSAHSLQVRGAQAAERAVVSQSSSLSVVFML